MHSKIRKSIFTILVILIIGALAVLYRLSTKVYYNDEDFAGNSAGNLYNGGLFCEYKDTIYFSNPEDDGAMYCMDTDCTNVRKLSDDRVASINVDDHYIYYSRRNYLKQDPMESIFVFRNTGLYRTNHEGKQIEMLFDGANGISSLYGNTLYYQHNSDAAMQFYSVGIDAKDNHLLIAEALMPASIYDGVMYYAGVKNDHYLHAYNVKTGNEFVASPVACYLPVAMSGGVYYISVLDGYSLCRIGHLGGEPETLVDEFISTYNITPDERYIFYQIDGGEDNRLVRLDVQTGLTTTIIDGNYKQLHLTSKYLFFRNFEDTTTYAYHLASGALSTFHPPVIK